MYCIYLYDATDAREARIKALVLLSYFSKPKKSEKILFTGVVVKIISN